MVNESPFGTVSRLSAPTLGVFRGREAVRLGVSRKRITAFAADGIVERVLPDTYRMTAVGRSSAQSLHAALLWAGPRAAAAGHSAGEVYRLEGVHASTPEIVVFPPSRVRSELVVVHRSDNRAALMVRRRNGIDVTGTEPTLVALAGTLEAEAFEIACEDARRRRLTSLSSLRSYVDRFANRPGATNARRLLDDLDPAHPARSTLEVKTRRLLVANGFTDFVREFPLTWNDRTYLFDFAFRGAPHDPRDQRPPVARRRHRLRTRQREVERPRSVRLPRRLLDVGQGHATRRRTAVGAHRNPRRCLAIPRRRWGVERWRVGRGPPAASSDRSRRGRSCPRTSRG